MIRGGRVVVFVADVGSAVRFYVETLGMKLVDEQPDASVIDAGEGLLLALEVAPKGATTTTIILEPKIPIAEAVAILENRGIVFDSGSPVAGTTSARFHDPDGNVLVLAQRSTSMTP